MLVACLLAVPGIVFAANDFKRYLTASVQLYKDLEYERALEQLQRARQLARGVYQDVTVALHEGIILGDMGRQEQSRAAFKTALLLNPEATLPFKVSPKVERDFEEVRARVFKDLGINPSPRKAEPPKVATSPPPSPPTPTAPPTSGAPATAAREPAGAPHAKPPASSPAAVPPASAPMAAPPPAVAKTPAAAPPPAVAKTPAATPPPAVARTDRPEQPAVKPDLKPPATAAPAPFVPRVEESSPGRVPVAPVVLAGVGVAAAGVGTVFGLQSRARVSDARGTPFQDESQAHLADARSSARVANVLFGTAAIAATGSLVTWLLSSGESQAPELKKEAR
jgi:hypothetical protein